MDLEVQWDGNPSIVLGVKTRLGVALPVQVFSHNYYLLDSVDRLNAMISYCC